MERTYLPDDLNTFEPQIRQTKSAKTTNNKANKPHESSKTIKPHQAWMAGVTLVWRGRLTMERKTARGASSQTNNNTPIPTESSKTTKTTKSTNHTKAKQTNKCVPLRHILCQMISKINVIWCLHDDVIPFPSFFVFSSEVIQRHQKFIKSPSIQNILYPIAYKYLRDYNGMEFAQQPQ